MKPKWMAIVGIVLLLMILSLGTATVDYQRVKSSRAPIFSVYAGGFLDGGTRGYMGFGYILYTMHNKRRLAPDGTEQVGVVVGPKLWLFYAIPINGSHWRPLLDDDEEEQKAWREFR